MDPQALQLPLLDLLNPDSPSPLDFLFLATYYLGHWTVLLGLSLLLTLKDRRLGGHLLLVLLLTAAVVFPLKLVVGEDRPSVHPTIREVGPRETDGSFPSGHAAFSFAFALVLTRFFPRWRGAFFLAAGGISFGRLYMGHHYPLDVLAGIGIGLLMASLVLREDLGNLIMGARRKGRREA
jgi:undecaprenyl-diphosphatase